MNIWYFASARVPVRHSFTTILVSHVQLIGKNGTVVQPGLSLEVNHEI